MPTAERIEAKREQRFVKRQYQKAAKAIESKPVVPVYGFRGRQIGWCLRHGEFIVNASRMRVLLIPRVDTKGTPKELRRQDWKTRREARLHWQHDPLP